MTGDTETRTALSPTAERASEIVADRRSGGRGPRRSSAARLIAGFTAAGVLVTVGLAVGIALVARDRATAIATEQATQIAFITAKGAVEPTLGPGVLAGDPAALGALDGVVHRSVLSGSLVRVKIWDADGRVVYSDDPALVGRRFDLEDEELTALNGGGQDSDVSDLTRPENAREVQFGRLLEVYTGVRTTTGVPLLYEAYFRYDAVADAGWDAYRTFAPLSVGALLVLELVQVPLAVVLARRLRGRERQRERLLRHAVEASTGERRRIAQDLHDGVVQELTGITYGLDASRMKGEADPERGAVVADAASRLRESVGALRTLLVDIYPPNLAEEGLEPALHELAAGLQRRGLQVEVVVDGAAAAPPDDAALLYRAAQETLRNVVSHSGADRVELHVSRGDDVWRLVVDDDGRGFDEQVLPARRHDGHVGLRALGDLVADAGGTMTIRAAPGAGTRVEVEVPRS